MSNNQGDGARRARDLLLFANVASAGAATILSRGKVFHTLVNTHLIVYVDEGASGTPIRVNFNNPDDFANPANPTVAEIVTVLNANAAFAAAATASAAADGRLQIVSDTTGTVSQLVIGNGTANPVFGWPEGFDVDSSDAAIAVPVYKPEEEPPAQIDIWTYDIANETFTRVVDSTGEVQDYDGELVTIAAAAAAVHCFRIRF